MIEEKHYILGEYPKELYKKVSLLKHFENILLQLKMKRTKEKEKKKKKKKQANMMTWQLKEEKVMKKKDVYMLKNG